MEPVEALVVWDGRGKLVEGDDSGKLWDFSKGSLWGGVVEGNSAESSNLLWRNKI